RSVRQFVAAQVLVEAGAIVGSGAIVDTVPGVLTGIGVSGIAAGQWIETGIGAGRDRAALHRVANRGRLILTVRDGIVVIGIGITAGLRYRVAAGHDRVEQISDDINRQHAVRCLAHEWFNQNPIG